MATGLSVAELAATELWQRGLRRLAGFVATEQGLAMGLAARDKTRGVGVDRKSGRLDTGYLGRTIKNSVERAFLRLFCPIWAKWFWKEHCFLFLFFLSFPSKEMKEKLCFLPFCPVIPQKKQVRVVK